MTENSKKTTDQSVPPPPDDPAAGKPERFGRRSMPSMGVDVKKIRTFVARVIWGVCVLFAIVLAAEVLLVVIEANQGNDLVTFVRDFADKIDLGFFDLSDPIKDFDLDEPNTTDAGTVLFNYGLAAVAWLVIGKILDKIVRP